MAIKPIAASRSRNRDGTRDRFCERGGHRSGRNHDLGTRDSLLMRTAALRVTVPIGNYSMRVGGEPIEAVVLVRGP